MNCKIFKFGDIKIMKNEAEELLTQLQININFLNQQHYGFSSV